MDIRPDKRQPITKAAITAAVAKHRADWPKWTSRHRNASRWDMEATLEAEIKHGRDNHRRATETGTEADFLPRERAALHALGALHQATAARTQLRDHLTKTKAQKKAARDYDQTLNYRAEWTARFATSMQDLRPMIRRRRRDWQRALAMITIYQSAAQS